MLYHTKLPYNSNNNLRNKEKNLDHFYDLTALWSKSHQRIVNFDDYGLPCVRLKPAEYF